MTTGSLGSSHPPRAFRPANNVFYADDRHPEPGAFLAQGAYLQQQYLLLVQQLVALCLPGVKAAVQLKHVAIPFVDKNLGR